MSWIRRIFLFSLVNILVMVTITTVIQLLGLQSFFSQKGLDYGSLMVFCLVWGFGGAFISLFISRWMAKTMMGVQVIDPANPGSEDERWLIETVHRLAQSARLETMPEVGFYNSPDPNAFATGPGRDSALVAVSSGLFQVMNKDEIEGVLGHELTHVTNGDMVTMTLLQGVINSFVMFLAYAVSFALTRSNDRRESNYMTQYLVRMALQMLFGILGMIPLMAFSRWREYRADAGSARLAGKTKMINALKELQKAYDHPPVKAPAEPAAVAAFKISSRDGFSLFASHPPLQKRIERLESYSGLASLDE